jgi:hypothetical protein
MTRRRKAALPVVAVVAVLTGLWTTATGLRETARLESAIRRKRAEAQEARRLREELAALDAARAAWDNLPRAELTPVDELFRRMDADLAAPEVSDRGSEPLADGWRRRRVEVVFHEAPLEWIATFLARCAEERPPWRAVEIRIVASETARGYGRVALTLEGLERTERAP